MGTRAVTKHVLSAAVATSGTFSVGYPDNFTGGHFTGGVAHVMTSSYGKMTAPDDFTVSFGYASATITYLGATTLAKGTEIWIEFDTPGRTRDELVNNALPAFVAPAQLHWINLGSPKAADDDGICTAATIGAAGDYTIDGAEASGGVATLDVPRNVTLKVATSDHSARTFTITGTDGEGNALVENITGPNNNTVAGKKAFKTVTGVSVDGAIATNGVSVGFADVLGLPVHLASAACVLEEFEDLAAATSGTLVAGLSDATASTATTGDVRGTYDPNSACDGSKAFALLVALPNPDFLGNAQYSG